MMRNFFSMLIILAFTVSCKTTQQNTLEKSNNPSKTYAEISIAQGGQWNGNVYENGTSFKNVDNLWVPKSHTDHSWYIRYEGPGWESNKIGYRIYLDWRNAIDIYGKLTDSLVLHKIGQDGFESYHHPQSWGMDILKVGKGLGIGSIGRIVNGEVMHFNEVDSTYASVHNSNLESSVKITYKGWKTADDKINLTSTLSIKPDSRVTKHTIETSNALPGLCTGIVNHKVDYFTSENSEKTWGYIATYGIQSLVPDQLGMAIFYQKNSVQDIFTGKDDYLITFKPTTDTLTFYFVGAWEQEQNGIKNKTEFIVYLNQLLSLLNKNNSL